jgi:hypothetical protein
VARQIIVLERVDPDNVGINRFRVAFWLAVPLARQAFYANAAAVSAVRDGSVTQAETDALRNGAVVEQVIDFQAQPGRSLVQVEADLVTAYNAAQQALNSNVGLFQRYGSFYDGASWTVKNIA